LKSITPIVLGLAWALLGCGDTPEPTPDGASRGAGPPPREREPSSAAKQPLNLVLITLDTTRADALGAYGQVKPTTPHLDALAATGVRFERALSSAPTTLPSHSTILTGKLPFAHGARSNHGYQLAVANETLAEVLLRHGYATAAEVAAPVIGRQTQIDQGFERFRDLFSPGIEKKRLHMFDGKVVLGAVGTHDVETHWIDERTASDISDAGVEFIRAHRKQKFFLWLHYFDPHVFYLPPQASLERIPDDPYLAEVHYMDEQVGRVLDQIRGLGLDARTVVVVTADHGEGRDEHGENTHSYFVYDTTIHVPLLMWGPKLLRGGKTIDSLVRTADIAPTVLELLELPPLEGIHGRSLIPLIRGQTADLDLAGYGETIEPAKFGASMVRFIQRGRWKYVHKVGPELYDTDADPRELANLADQNPDQVAELRTELERMIASAAAPQGNRATVTGQTRAQLEALGYLAASPSPEREAGFGSLELDGNDPVDIRDEIHTYASALRASQSGRFERAQRGFAQLWQSHRNPYFGLQRAEALMELGRFEEALGQLQEIVAEHGGHAEALTRIGGLLLRDGRVDAAIESLQSAFGIDPCTPSAATFLAHAAYLRGQHRDQRDTLRLAVETCDEEPDLLNNFAYLLATNPDPALRDGARAVQLASRVVELDPEPNPGHRDTLAAAHAEAGDFAAAIAQVRDAIELAGRQNPELVAELQGHLESFEAGRPLRDPP
jgi:arylsulfatase A-like enzyme/Flp pilus assembly protein TadD